MAAMTRCLVASSNPGLGAGLGRLTARDGLRAVTRATGGLVVVVVGSEYQAGRLAASNGR